MFPTTREAMTPDPVTLHASMPIRDAARAMRDMGIGDVLVRHADGSLGIVTDRDLAIRALADGADPDTAPVGDSVAMSSSRSTLTTRSMPRSRSSRSRPSGAFPSSLTASWPAS
jgi:CBS domain-containing protein